MPEPAGAVAERDAEAEAPAASRIMHGDVLPMISVHPAQKCPYLAGRPPHGSYHLWPSGVNVCYARGTSADKPYGHASKETQREVCFCGTAVYEECDDYARARANAVTLPAFDGAGPNGERGGHDTRARGVRRERKRLKRRSRRSPFRKWMESSAASALVCACWILLALVAYWLVARSM